MVPYVSFLLQTLSDILKAFKTTKNSDPLLWFCIIGIFRRALSYDDNGMWSRLTLGLHWLGFSAFWRDDKLRQLQDGLTSQIQVCVRLNHIEGRKQLQDCLSALLDSITDDTLLKTVNLNVLMHTRSEDSRVRIFALSCAEVLWRSHGGRLVGKWFGKPLTYLISDATISQDLRGRQQLSLQNVVKTIAKWLEKQPLI